jgi:hypothetical protein
VTTSESADASASVGDTQGICTPLSFSGRPPLTLVSYLSLTLVQLYSRLRSVHGHTAKFKAGQMSDEASTELANHGITAAELLGSLKARHASAVLESLLMIC